MQKHIKKLCESLEIELPKKAKDKSYLIKIDEDTEVNIWFLDPGFYFHSNLSTFPSEKKEALFIYLMRANLLSQGTGGSRIGMAKEENFLTLSDQIAYEVNYI
ncbi:MAG: hypothetical protein KR126chlam6_01447, partial [Candidatus Anoxychlamydiales bacterium]|nr:hypothetical protein [Candidatus Anoxychlamydiales bacterium]